MLTLRPYQEEALDALDRHLSTKTNNPCVVLPTGSGKSFVIAEAVRRWKEAYPPFRCIILAHRKELVDQNSKEFLGLVPDADVGIYAAGLDAHETSHSITFAGIDSVYNKAAYFSPFDAILVDEAHRIPVRGEGKYRKFIAECRGFNPNVKVVGFTATPFRLGSGPICHKDYILNEVCYEANVGDLIRDGYLCNLRSKVSEVEPDLSRVKKSCGDYQQKALGETMRSGDLVARAVKDALLHLDAENRTSCVWFCVDVAHCTQVLNMLTMLDERAVAVTGSSSDAERDAAVDAFRNRAVRHILNVNVFTEGFNVKQVDAVVLLRPTLSKGLYCLDSETEVLTPDGWSKSVTVGDEVWAMDMDGSMKTVKVVASVRRRLDDDEHFVSFKSPSVDIRVTDRHRMVYETRRNPGWRICTAEKIASLKDGCVIPISGIAKFSGVPLTDDELRFIGWVMTDGTINRSNNAISISQSTVQPWCDDIQRCIEGCGLKYGKRITEYTTQFHANGKRVTWTISKGRPRGRDKHLRGWGHLAEYISKDISEKLFDMDERQFSVMLESIHQGDGHKQNGQNWTRRSYHISTGNYTFADRLQRLAVVRGWKANISVQSYNKNKLYDVHLKKTSKAYIGSSYDGRPVWRSENHIDETCWCVENELGTLVVRRKGKVAIVGNCQMVGRGLRLHPDKSNCLVLDYARCIESHGPIDSLEAGKVAVEVCGSCREVFARGIRVCPKCGWEVPKKVIEERERVERERQMHEVRAAQLAILASTPQEYPVSSVSVSRHEKNGTASLCVAYRCGIQLFREWICLDHAGYAHEKAAKWWKAHFGDDAHIPTVDEALGDMFLGYEIAKRTESVTVVKQGKYNEIIGYKLKKRE